MKTFTREEKCHHAAYAYVLIGIAYTIVGTVGMPPHDYGALLHGLTAREFPSLAAALGPNFPYATALWATLITLGLLFFGLSWFIYYGYRSVLYGLTGIYLLRTLFSGRAAVLAMTGSGNYSGMIVFMFLMILLIFYLLLRAIFDLKP